MKGKRWKYWEEYYLKKNWGKITVEEISNHLGRSKKAVEKKCNELKLIRRCDYWSPEDEEYLQEYYHKLSVSNIALKLGRTEKAVRTHACNMGVTKPHGLNWIIEKQKELKAEGII